MSRKFREKVEIGKIYGRWEVLEYLGIKRIGKATFSYWRCKCRSCGVIADRMAGNITGSVEKGKLGCASCTAAPDSAISRAYRTYKRQARIRGLEFNIPKDRFKELIKLDCHYCGLPPEINSYSEDAKIKVPMNGLDRVNSDLPYTESNVKPCCKMCNLAKLDYTEHVFLNWIHRVAEFQRDKIEPDWLDQIEDSE